MKATVVIPTYNRAERLTQLLACLTTQGDALARVVVCDDGSSDNTAAVARSFADRLPLVYVWQENKGFRAGQARNLGIARAEGDVVIFVDDDVLVASDFVAQHLAAHASSTRRVAVGYRSRAFIDGPPATPIVWNDYDDAEPDDRVVDIGKHGENISQHATPWLFVYSCNFSVSAPALRADGIRNFDDMPRFDKSFVGWGMEDIEYGYRLQHSGYEVVPALGARVLHAEDTHPRDPFRCEVRTLAPTYDSYVRNAIHFMDKYPDDAALAARIRTDLRWYVRDEARGCWVKNGHANDIEKVLTHHRRERAEQSQDENA